MHPSSFSSDPLSSESELEDEGKPIDTKLEDEGLEKGDCTPDRENDLSQKDFVKQLVGNPGSHSFYFHTNLSGSSIGNYANQVLDDANQQVNSAAQKEQSQYLKPSNLTRPLPQKSRLLPEVKVRLNELSEYADKLNEDFLIIIASANSRVALSVAYSLVEHIAVLNRRWLTAERGDLKYLEAEPSIENTIIRPKIDGEHPSLIIIETYEMQTFLDSLIVRDSTVASLKEDLRNCKRLCICLTDSQALKTTLERKKIQLSFPLWEIPFEQEEASREEQQGIRRQSLAEYEDGQSAISLYETADTLKKIVLYVATFFQNLSIDDFERIVTLLLADQAVFINDSDPRNDLDNGIEEPLNSSESTISVTVGEQIITFNQSQKRGVYQEQINHSGQSPNHRRRLLRDVWEEDAKQILKSCQLELAFNEYGSRAIEFSMPRLRNELSNYFKNEEFLEYRNKFRKLVDLGLLFDDSYHVAKALRDLSVSMMLFQPGTEFWVNWLEQYTTSALECSVNSKKTDLVYYYVADLLRETLDYPQLEDLTEAFLERLISLKRHDAVLLLSKRLRFSPQFDEYYWFKQSIDRGNDDTRRRAYRLLYELLKQSSSRVYEILEKIHTWIPDLETDPGKYSPSNRYALQLLLEYLVETVEKFDPKFCGGGAFSYPLFGGLRSGKSIDLKLQMIIEWLLHPGMNSIVYEVDSLSIISILVFPGLFSILLGLEEDISVKIEFSDIVDSLLSSINNVIDSYEKEINIQYRRDIVGYWRTLSMILLESSNYEMRVNKNWYQSSLLNYRRNIIDYLVERIDP